MALAINVASCLSLLLFSCIALYRNDVLSISLYDLHPELRIAFFIDRLSAFFILIISLVSMSVAIYSFGYVEHYKSSLKKNLLVSLMAFFVLSMVLVVASKNTVSFLFFWESMALSSFLLVMFEYEKKETRYAGLFYFVMTQVSTVFLLSAFILLQNVSGSFDISRVSASPTTLTIVFVLLFIGFGIKAGIIPFHKWLPYAHPASPSNISALMSGIMIKVAIYGLFRCIIFMLDPALSWGVIIFVAGVISAILGVIYALKEHDLKRLLAYHSIENIGIILIGFGLYLIFSHYGLKDLAMLGLAGALFHTLNHALFKSLLFMTAGAVVNATKTRNIERLGGLIKRMPYTSLLFLIGAVSISALPPFNGFVSEFMIFQLLFKANAIGDPILVVILVIGLLIFALTSALAAACFVKAFATTFLALPRSKNAERATESGRSMLVGSAIIAVSCIVLGVFSFQIFSIFGYPDLVPDMLLISIVLLGFYAIAVVAMRSFASNREHTGETWGCGIRTQNPRMEYTASGFSEPIVTIFRSIYKTKKVNERTFFDRHKSIFKQGTAKIQLFKFFDLYFYLPVARTAMSISARMVKAQRGDINRLIALAFAAVVLLLIIVWWFA